MMSEEKEERFESALLQQGKIYLRGRINSEQVDKIARLFLFLDAQENKEIVLYINSRGGNTEAGFDIYGILKHVKSPITGVVLKEACSMAILLLQACGKRKIMKNAILAFHDIGVSLGRSWRGYIEEAVRRVEAAEKEQNDYNRIIAERSGIRAEEVSMLCEQAKILSAEDALKMGLVDEII